MSSLTRNRTLPQNVLPKVLETLASPEAGGKGHGLSPERGRSEASRCPPPSTRQGQLTDCLLIPTPPAQREASDRTKQEKISLLVNKLVFPLLSS